MVLDDNSGVMFTNLFNKLFTSDVGSLLAFKLIFDAVLLAPPRNVSSGSDMEVRFAFELHSKSPVTDVS